jgi:Domain of unknown function (DUF4082)/Right handed beta helix region/IPT/TIG domain
MARSQYHLWRTDRPMSNGQLPPGSAGGGYYPGSGNTGPKVLLVDDPTATYITTQQGEIIEGKRFTNGFIDLRHDNCIVRNCEINSSEFFGIDGDGTQGTLIEDCRIIGIGGQGGIVLGDSSTARRNDISKFSNGILFGGTNIVIENNYIHDLTAIDEEAAHFDGVQTGGCSNVLIRGNTIAARDTSNVFLKPDYGPIDNVQILNNKFTGEVGFNIYASDDLTAWPDRPVTDIEVAGNTGELGSYGFIAMTDTTVPEVNIHGNSMSPRVVTALTLTSMNPTTKTVGDLDFVLTVTGMNFTSFSEIWFDGTPQTTSFISSTQLSCTIAMINRTAGNKTVRVKDGSTLTGALSFPIQAIPDADAVSFYENIPTPGGNKALDTTDVTLGFRLDPLVSGKISAIKWFRADASECPDGWAALWHRDGTLLQSVYFANHAGVGWASAPLRFAVPLSVTECYIVGVWRRENTAGNVYYQAEGAKFPTVGMSVPGVMDMPPSNGQNVRGYDQRNNVFVYDNNDIKMPTQHFNGGGYYIDCDFVAGDFSDPPREFAAYPSVRNTGPTGTLTVFPNPITVEANEAGRIIQNLDVQGQIYIKANNVTVRNCKVKSGGLNASAVIYFQDGVTGGQVIDCELNGSGDSDGIKGVIGERIIVQRCNIWNCEDGVTFRGTNNLIADNYMHGNAAAANPDPHFDGVSCDGGGLNSICRHNTIVLPANATCCFNINNDFGSVQNILVEDNICIGGGYQIMFDARFTRTPGATITSCIARNNVHASWAYNGIVWMNCEVQIDGMTKIKAPPAGYFD